MIKKKEEKRKTEVINFEVQYLMDSRWTIDVILPEENEAVEHARELLQCHEEFQAVRVMRHRISPNGFTSENEIYELKAPKRDKVFRLKGRPEEAPLCEEADDLAGIDARIHLHSLLRDYLNATGLTVTELLHTSNYLRKLAETSSLLSAAIYQVGGAQAQKAGVAPKERINLLQSFLKTWISRGSELMTERRRLPNFEPEDIERLTRKIRSNMGEQNVDWALRGLLSLWLTAQPGIEAKMRMMLDQIPLAEDNRGTLWLLIDEITADALMSADTMTNLFGNQPSLRAFLSSLANMLLLCEAHESEIEERREEQEGLFPGASPYLEKILYLIRAGHGNECRKVLMHRLLREVQSGRALDKRNADQENANIRKLREALTRPDKSLLGGAPMDEALRKRRKELRRQQLRDLGMEDAADAV